MPAQAVSPGHERQRRRRTVVGLCGLLSMSALAVAPARAHEDPGDDPEKLMAFGRYAEAIEAARRELELGERLEPRLLVVEALALTGQRTRALAEADVLLQRHAGSLRALGLAHDVLRENGRTAAAATALSRLQEAMRAPGSRLEAAPELVAAGQAALRLGDEPKAVLTTYFEAAVERDPRCRRAYLAAGSLALAEHDDALAADWFRRGLAKVGADADLHAGLARAFYQSDRAEMLGALDAALDLNPRHVGALLLRAEQEIDAEDDGAARHTLDRVRAVDPDQPSAWAFEAVLAHLGNDAAGEARARLRALAVWPLDPAIDALIGRKLAEKYRFVESAAYERRALALDPTHLPAKMQLAHDLLRLGREKEGWALAEQVHQADGYDVVAYNLVKLRAHVDKLAVRRQGDLLVRMAPQEQRLYGDDVLALLREAQTRIGGKYGARGGRPVEVEIFPDQADFAVRTFGLPGGAGYLGVCFGNLVTMNSPASGGAAPVSWRSVLWHEYTHVVTLGLTHNKMPRWLSEGISVYEEGERDRTWGQAMTPRYREMILGGDLVPVGKLSAAFMSPRTPEHLMFAYFESALVVRFVVERFGFPALRAILTELGAGVAIGRTLEAHTLPMPALEQAFAAYAQAQARAFAPEADFAAPEPGAARWRAAHPRSVWALEEEARRLIDEGDLAGAKERLVRLVALHPESKGPRSAYLLLALVHRKLGAPDEERRALERLAAMSSDAVPAYTRLLELAEASGDAAALATNGERLLGVNPMTAAGWRAVGRGHEARAAADRGAALRAITAYEKLLALAPADPADTHFRLARLLRSKDARRAKRHLLDALAEAPRFRAGHRLLLELERGGAGRTP